MAQDENPAPPSINPARVEHNDCLASKSKQINCVFFVWINAQVLRKQIDMSDVVHSLDIPTGLTATKNEYPVVFVNTEGLDIRRADVVDRVNAALMEALEGVHQTPIEGQGLIKVHIGEPRNDTHMRPEYTRSSRSYLIEKGASGAATGDSTVAYTGPRGHKDNPPGDVTAYKNLAKDHGWTPEGPAGTPFVVLDRPSSSVPGVFEVKAVEYMKEVEGINRYHDFYLAGGFEEAGFLLNHAHLTLHGLAGVAGCVKSIAMGCAALKGKYRMHQSLLPHFDEERCILCGNCVRNCPEEALSLEADSSTPVLDADKCIGCGECEAVCASIRKAVKLSAREISDWSKGQDTLPIRMTDYTMGLMNGKWENTIHVLHVYDVTERCDCIDVKQKPIPGADRGFLVGKNPFAMDKLGGRLLNESLGAEGIELEPELLCTADAGAAYALEQYGIISEPRVETIRP